MINARLQFIEMNQTFRVQKEAYVPKPGEIILHVKNYRCEHLAFIITDHDGTEEHLRDLNMALRARADRKYCCVSGIQSLTFFRTDDDFGIISPNGKCIASLDSLEGRAMMGDVEAIRATSEIESE